MDSKQVFRLLAYGLFVSLLFLHCKEKNLTRVQQPELPVIPQDEWVVIMNSADAIDFIFHELPFSVNQTDLNSVKQTIQGISIRPVEDLRCPAIGRMFVQARGEMIAEVEVHFQMNNCGYYVFYRGNDPIYASQMTIEAKTFYTSLIQSPNNQ